MNAVARPCPKYAGPSTVPRKSYVFTLKVVAELPVVFWFSVETKFAGIRLDAEYDVPHAEPVELAMPAPG